MSCIGPLRSSGGVTMSNFDFTHLSIHATKMEKKGTLRQKRRPKGDPNPQKGPLGDPGPLKGTHVGTVGMVICTDIFVSVQLSVSG